MIADQQLPDVSEPSEHDFKQYGWRVNTKVPAHHCAIGIGHISGKLSKLGQLPGMECTVVS
jgi:L-arabinose isomerase